MLEAVIRQNSDNTDIQKHALQKIQDELRTCNSELHATEENKKKLLNEKMILEERISRLEKKKVDEIRTLEKDLEQERKMTKHRISELEKQLAEYKVLYKEETVLRKRNFNTIEDMKGKIRVYCRLRPLTPKERTHKENDVVTCVDEFTVQHVGRDGMIKKHFYDRVFDGSATQKDVFNDTRYLVQSTIDGYNVWIFAYGQTVSGKTFTIYGSKNDPGLTPLATSELFQILEKDRDKFNFSLKLIWKIYFIWLIAG
ncbi:unnamed protein product [Lactuca virosa]|uniref:Kinesin motor domain-containing protein n=1 Tax=Lactuca virosa TaxID=75947 RepID=A0AAU9PDC3_9ASTR|nr:unnamed protein product [Lactuca virosa]